MSSNHEPAGQSFKPVIVATALSIIISNISQDHLSMSRMQNLRVWFTVHLACVIVYALMLVICFASLMYAGLYNHDDIKGQIIPWIGMGMASLGAGINSPGYSIPTNLQVDEDPNAVHASFAQRQFGFIISSVFNTILVVVNLVLAILMNPFVYNDYIFNFGQVMTVIASIATLMTIVVDCRMYQDIFAEYRAIIAAPRSECSSPILLEDIDLLV